jgi:hypothetical protein
VRRALPLGLKRPPCSSGQAAAALVAGAGGAGSSSRLAVSDADADRPRTVKTALAALQAGALPAAEAQAFWALFDHNPLLGTGRAPPAGWHGKGGGAAGGGEAAGRSREWHEAAEEAAAAAACSAAALSLRALLTRLLSTLLTLTEKVPRLDTAAIRSIQCSR